MLRNRKDSKTKFSDESLITDSKRSSLSLEPASELRHWLLRSLWSRLKQNSGTSPGLVPTDWKTAQDSEPKCVWLRVGPAEKKTSAGRRTHSQQGFVRCRQRKSRSVLTVRQRRRAHALELQSVKTQVSLRRDGASEDLWHRQIRYVLMVNYVGWNTSKKGVHFQRWVWWGALCRDLRKETSNSSCNRSDREWAKVVKLWVWGELG